MKLLLAVPLMLIGASLVAAPGKELPALPDMEGFAGAFAGMSNGALIVAGGANFPDKRPWQGGKKVGYDTVFVLNRPDGKWQGAGKLPRPLGYGVAATTRNGIVCVGGSDAERHHADAFRLEWTGEKLIHTPLPPLPKPRANTCGALVGDTLYIAGGQEKPDSVETSKAVWRMDLAAARPTWQEVEPFPGSGRMLAMAASFDGAFWLVGGVDLVPRGTTTDRRYLRDAYRYDPGRGWSRVADLPYPLAAAPTPAPADVRGFYLLGGDDGSKVGFTPPEQHPGFRNTILRYDRATAKWLDVGEVPAPRVTTPCVIWNNAWIVPTGEARPGVRSPLVWALSPPTR